MKWFTIDGKEYAVRVFEPEETFSILYSENTGRTLGVGVPIVLDPLGTFFNYSMEFGAIRGKESDFEALWQALSEPREEPFLVVFPRNRNGFWETKDAEGNTVSGFYAYVSSGKRKIKKIEETIDGELKNVSYDTFSANFIATKAQVTPYD